MGKVSIIVPVYNVDKYLERTVLSLLNQTYQNLEILLIDDGSKDNSRKVMEQLAAADSRVVLLFQKVNQGVSAARNRGLDEMTGEWVCFCDGDDWYEPTFVEKMLDCAAAEKADYIVCDYQIASDGKAPIPSSTVSALNSGCALNEMLALGPISSCTHMIRRSLFDVSGLRYPTECRQYEELPVIPALLKYATKVGIVKESLYNYYQRGNGTSASNNVSRYVDNFNTALSKLSDILGDGYEKELEYHAIYALHYGEILMLCKQGAKRKDVVDRILELEKDYPKYLSNPYVKRMGKAKFLFLLAEKWHMVFALKVFAKIHSMRVN